MGFQQPPSTILFDYPHTQTTPLISPRIHQKMYKYLITWKINLRGLQQAPSEDEG